MNNYLFGFGLVVYTTVSMIALTVKDNRDFAREELLQLKGLNRRDVRFIHVQNSDEMLEKWKEEKIAEKREWLSLPFYKQLKSPPIHCIVDLHQRLEEKQ